MGNRHQDNQPNFIEFVPLCETHFPLLLKWLESAHVKPWWDPDTIWDSKKIYEKYETYVKGYKIEDDIKKRIQAF